MLGPRIRLSRDGSPLIRAVSRAALEIKGEHAFEGAIRCSVAWMKRRSPGIPDSAFKGEPFEVGAGGHHPAEAVRLEVNGARLWSAILDDDDRTVPRRTWVTEVTVGEKDGRTAFAARLFNVTRGGDALFARSRPGMVHGIVCDLEAEADGLPLFPDIIQVDTNEGFDQFWSLLINPNRTLPLIVTACSSGTPTAIELPPLGKMVSGLAHIVGLNEESAWKLTDRVGKKLSVFDGASRIYGPDFDPYESSASDHPLWFRGVADEHSHRHSRLEQVADYILRNSIRSPKIPEFPRFSEVRRLSDERRSKRAKDEGTSDATMVALYEEDIKRLNTNSEALKAEHDEWLTEIDKELTTIRASEKAAVDDNYLLRQRLIQLENALRDNRREIPFSSLQKYPDIETWAEANLVGSIWISPKALRETRSASFENIELFSKTLIMLRDKHVPMRRNPGADQRDLYNGALAELGLEDSGCFKTPGDIKNFPAYKTTYKVSLYWCEDHIKYGVVMIIDTCSGFTIIGMKRIKFC